MRQPALENVEQFIFLVVGVPHDEPRPSRPDVGVIEPLPLARRPVFLERAATDPGADGSTCAASLVQFGLASQLLLTPASGRPTVLTAHTVTSTRPYGQGQCADVVPR